MQLGVTPVFCDALPDGNIDPDDIKRNLTVCTRAVVVTHMWGLPCDMKRIVIILQEHPGVLLLEDCSHAHGAMVDGQYVGTFGDGAVWSLQGQKIVTGGEGGIVLTKHVDFYHRQLLWSHPSRRSKAELPLSHRLVAYGLTGAGSKNRAHPIAVAIALYHLRRPSSFIEYKTLFAGQLASALGDISFLHVPDMADLARQRKVPAWYAFIVLFKKDMAPPGLTRELLVNELVSQGLCEVDVPHSTRPLHYEPLYSSPEAILPHIYHSGSFYPLHVNKSFPQAESFHNAVIKISVGALQEDAQVMKQYCTRIRAACKRWCSMSKL